MDLIKELTKSQVKEPAGFFPLSELLADLGGLAHAVAQVIQLGPTF